jgi:hypothetical protein
MKKISVFLLVALLTVMVVSPVLAAGFHQESVPTPTVPDWAVTLLSVGFTWLITNGLKSLSKALPWVTTLDGPATALAAALVGFVVVFGNGLLTMIPASYHPGVIALFGFIGTLLSAYGVHYMVMQFKPVTK